MGNLDPSLFCILNTDTPSSWGSRYILASGNLIITWTWLVLLADSSVLQFSHDIIPIACIGERAQGGSLCVQVSSGKSMPWNRGRYLRSTNPILNFQIPQQCSDSVLNMLPPEFYLVVSIRQGERGHLLVHSSWAHRGQGWTRVEAGSQELSLDLSVHIVRKLEPRTRDRTWIQSVWYGI